MQFRGPRYPALWDRGSCPPPGRVCGSRAGEEAQPCSEPLSPHRSPLSPHRLWSPPVTPSMERGGLGLASDRSPGRDTLRPGTLPSLSDLGDPVEAVKREEKKMKAARLKFNFQAESPKELTLQKGDIVYIHKEVDRNWLEGEHHGRVGIFPSNYVEILPPTEVPKPIKAPTLQVLEYGEALALYNFRGDLHVELSFRKVLCHPGPSRAIPGHPAHPGPSRAIPGHPVASRPSRAIPPIPAHPGHPDHPGHPGPSRAIPAIPAIPAHPGPFRAIPGHPRPSRPSRPIPGRSVPSRPSWPSRPSQAIPPIPGHPGHPGPSRPIPAIPAIPGHPRPPRAIPGHPVPSRTIPGHPGPSRPSRAIPGHPGHPGPFRAIPAILAIPGHPVPSRPSRPIPAILGHPVPSRPSRPIPAILGHPVPSCAIPAIPGHPGPSRPSRPSQAIPAIPGHPGPSQPSRTIPPIPGRSVPFRADPLSAPAAGRADLPGAAGERELVRGADLGHQPPGHLPRHLRAGAEGAAGQKRRRGHPRLSRPRRRLPVPAALSRSPHPPGSLRPVLPAPPRCHLPPVPKAAPRWHPQPLGGSCQPPTPCGRPPPGALASRLDPRAGECPPPWHRAPQRWGWGCRPEPTLSPHSARAPRHKAAPAPSPPRPTTAPRSAGPRKQRRERPGARCPHEGPWVGGLCPRFVSQVPGALPVPAPKRRRAGAAGRGPGGCHAAVRRRLVRGCVATALGTGMRTRCHPHPSPPLRVSVPAGVSRRTQKFGTFPGNYVAPV
uniref:SH3 domain-containing protein n=1 Tax=Taeniopygia guttata TaxID=59729 RepID=A0A674GNN7_TAEGU